MSAVAQRLNITSMEGVESRRLTSDASAHLTFQVQLNETINAIDVLYNRMQGQGTRATGGDATIGIQRGIQKAVDAAVADRKSVV